MKKITITKAEKLTGFNGAEADEFENVTTDYVGDDYEYDDYLSDYCPDEIFGHESGAVNFTLTIRSYENGLEQASMEFEDMAETLESLAALAAKTSGISEDDRERIVQALETASSAVGGLREECDNALFDVSAALNAFGNLQLTE